MSKKTIIAIAILLAVAAGGITAYSLLKPDEPAVYYAPPAQSFLDAEQIKALPVYSPNADKAEFREGDVILHRPWGDGEDEFKVDVTEEYYAVWGPSSYAVGDDGTIYVCDIYNNTLKAFKDNKLISSLYLGDKLDLQPGIGGFNDMVYYNGSLYGTNLMTAGIYKVTGTAVERLDTFGKFGNLSGLWLRSDGKLLIEDMYNGEVRTQIFDISGNCCDVGSQGFFVSQSALHFSDKYGNICRFTDNGYKSYVFTIQDSEDRVLYAMNFQSFDGEPPSGLRGKEYGIWDTCMGSLGCDSEGRYYLEYAVYYCEDNKSLPQSDQYFIRIDVRKSEVKTIKTDFIGDNPTDENPYFVGGGIWCGNHVTHDGRVLYAFVNAETGLTIKSFTFD